MSISGDLNKSDPHIVLGFTGPSIFTERPKSHILRPKF